MTKVSQVSDDQLKAMVTGNYSGVMRESTPDTPTEVIDLPSQGYFYPEGHPLASGKIEMRYMTAREEDILTSQNLIKQGIVIDKLLQALIVDKFDYNELLIADKNALMIAARVLGYGKDYEVEVACPACGEKSKHVADLTQFESKDIDFSKFTKGQNTFTFTLPASKKVLTLKFLTHADEKAVDEELKGLKKLSALTGVDSELEEIDIADLVKGKRYKYNHPLHSDEIEFDSEHKYPEGENMYGFRSGKTGYAIPGKQVQDYISHLDDEEFGSIEEQGGNVDDMDDDEVQSAYNFD